MVWTRRRLNDLAGAHKLNTFNAQGGVGIAFRYWDTTFSFLNTHLASDLKVGAGIS